MNCDKTAVALLTFSPQDAKAWLYDLEQPDPNGGIMLCRKHANATVVPMSWQLMDSRDPAWPGPANAVEHHELVPLIEAQPTVTPAALPEPLIALPSDTDAIDHEFAALQADLPVTPQPYAQPQMATARAAGQPGANELLIDLAPPVNPDPSLFELPLSDIPAVTPYTGSVGR